MKPTRTMIVLTAALLTAACTGPAAPTPPATTPPPSQASPTQDPTPSPTEEPGGVEPGQVPPTTSTVVSASADDVIDQVATTWWAADSTTDIHPNAATRRALPWLTAQYATQIDAATTQITNGGGARWLDLTAHQGRYVITLDDATDVVPDLPADTATTATRVRIVTLTPAGTDGWVGEPITLVATIAAERANETSPWLVASVAAEEPLPGAGDGLSYG